MKPTLAAIEAIDDEAFKEKKRRELCIKNDICPECGALIIMKNYEVYDKPHRFLFWKIKGCFWDYRYI